MSSSYSIQQTKSVVGVLYEVESFRSEEPPIEDWSSLDPEIPEENAKRILYEKGLYKPGSGEVCAKYVPCSASSVYRHPYYNYPSVLDPGVMEALLQPQYRTVYSDDGQELYLDLCRDMGICPIRIFYRNLLERVINLRYYGIHPTGLRPMAMSLKNNRIVKVLNLTDNWLSEDGCYHLGEMLLTNISLEEINLHGCRIGPEGARCLFSNIHVSRTLHTIDLTKNYITDVGAECLSKAIVLGSNIRNLNLSYNRLTAKSLVALAFAFETHNNLTHLNLCCNTIFSPAALLNLCNILSENTKLEEINFSWNSFTGPLVGNAIKKLMSAPNLRRLYLNNNKLLTAEITLIAQSLLISKKLTTLDLSNNPLTPKDALFLLSYFNKRRVKVQNLFLESILVNSEFIDLKDQILSLKFRQNAVITCGDVIPKIISKNVDVRELVLRRAEFLCSKSKKPAIHIALVILEICKLNTRPMNVKDFSRALKNCGAMKLDEDLIEEFACSFPGPGTKKMKTVDLANLVDYVHRKWPDKKLPPTPPQEVVVPLVVKDKKKQKK